MDRLSKNIFETCQSNLGDSRKEILNKLLEIKGIDFSIQDHGNELELSWQACEKLGISRDIINLLIKENKNGGNSCSSSVDGHSHCHSHSHSHSHSQFDGQDKFLHDLEHLEIFQVNRNDNCVWLKDFDQMQSEKISKIKRAIDYYLYFEYIKELRYEQYSLIDFFCELKWPTSKVMSKMASSYKSIKKLCCSLSSDKGSHKQAS